MCTTGEQCLLSSRNICQCIIAGFLTGKSDTAVITTRWRSVHIACKLVRHCAFPHVRFRIRANRASTSAGIAMKMVRPIWGYVMERSSHSVPLCAGAYSPPTPASWMRTTAERVAFQWVSALFGIHAFVRIHFVAIRASANVADAVLRQHGMNIFLSVRLNVGMLRTGHTHVYRP